MRVMKLMYEGKRRPRNIAVRGENLLVRENDEFQALLQNEWVNIRIVKIHNEIMRYPVYSYIII